MAARRDGRGRDERRLKMTDEKPTFEMVEPDLLLTGGLFRCCIETWKEKINDREYKPGDVIQCKHCNELMGRDNEGRWRWQYESA